MLEPLTLDTLRSWGRAGSGWGDVPEKQMDTAQLMGGRAGRVRGGGGSVTAAEEGDGGLGFCPEDPEMTRDPSEVTPASLLPHGPLCLSH